MRMPADDSADVRRRRIEVEFFHIMQHIEEVRLELHCLGRREFGRPLATINVPAHDHDRRDLRQAFQYLRLADVPGMDDKVGTF